eukprot:9491588-Pyramimonas_sp.AAC.1
MRTHTLLHFTGAPVPITARTHSTPETPVPFSHPVSSPRLSPASLPFGPANITRDLKSRSYSVLDAPVAVLAAERVQRPLGGPRRPLHGDPPQPLRLLPPLRDASVTKA